MEEHCLLNRQPLDQLKPLHTIIQTTFSETTTQLKFHQIVFTGTSDSQLLTNAKNSLTDWISLWPIQLPYNDASIHSNLKISPRVIRACIICGVDDHTFNIRTKNFERIGTAITRENYVKKGSRIYTCEADRQWFGRNHRLKISCLKKGNCGLSGCRACKLHIFKQAGLSAEYRTKDSTRANEVTSSQLELKYIVTDQPDQLPATRHTLKNRLIMILMIYLLIARHQNLLFPIVYHKNCSLLATGQIA
ncbi:unnamed protein product [Oppiella nova]|uniref:Uncharacterized protein n=1 Tax=Oppiella nova TaxID=334625 RepID=A0A7R9QMW0_9ACAR|nr:unnamed protein product [Oppiella nova]CAG2168960.1 unnamed protein product [Oppiella nova]